MFGLRKKRRRKIRSRPFPRALNTSYEEALIKVQEALKEEGFGVLTTIDVQSTLKKRLNVDFRKYTILGACSPFYAFQALQTDLDVGLFYLAMLSSMKQTITMCTFQR